jgi:hypothetical protein
MPSSDVLDPPSGLSFGELLHWHLRPDSSVLHQPDVGLHHDAQEQGDFVEHLLRM